MILSPNSEKLQFRLRFTSQLILLVTLLTLEWHIISLGSYAVSSIVLAIIIILCFTNLIYFVEGHIRLVERFFESANNGDFSQQAAHSRFSVQLRDNFNQLNTKLSENNHARTSENNYLLALIRQAPVAILAYDKLGRISLYNAAARKLFSCSSPTSLDDLEVQHPNLLTSLSDIQSGGRKLLRLKNNGIEHNLMFSSSKALLNNKDQTLLTVESIGRELMDAEHTAWKNLISVLTHEVMNSVTPITSLSTTCNDIIRKQDLLSLDRASLEQELNDISVAIDTIENRGKGIMSFVESYRKLAKLPEPHKESLSLLALLNEQCTLHQSSCAQQGIELLVDVQPNTLTIDADKQQLEQVLINLFLNAIEALEKSEDKRISIRARLNSGKTIIEFKDTGCGIASEELEKVFVPFFTTKRHGSGIGMALTRQIIHAHGGQVSIWSEQHNGFRVELIF